MHHTPKLDLQHPIDNIQRRLQEKITKEERKELTAILNYLILDVAVQIGLVSREFH